MLGFRERSISADDGASLHAFIHDGETAPVLMLHDLGMDARYWEPFLAAALHRQPKLAVAAIDLRGHGGSELGSETSRKRMVKDLRKWIQQLEIDPPIVVGHGYGADIALAADFIGAAIAVNPAFGRAPANVEADLHMPAAVTGPVSEDALRMCEIGANAAKPIRRSRRDPESFFVLSEPADLGPDALTDCLELAVDVQHWQNGSRHLPIESPTGLAALVLGVLEEVA